MPAASDDEHRYGVLDRPHTFDVRWTFGLAVVLFFASGPLPDAAYPLLAGSSALLVVTGAAVMVDFRHAIDYWLKGMHLRPNEKWPPRTIARMSAAVTLIVGLIGLVGSVGMMVVG